MIPLTESSNGSKTGSATKISPAFTAILPPFPLPAVRTEISAPLVILSCGVVSDKLPLLPEELDADELKIPLEIVLCALSYTLLSMKPLISMRLLARTVSSPASPSLNVPALICPPDSSVKASTSISKLPPAPVLNCAALSTIVVKLASVGSLLFLPATLSSSARMVKSPAAPFVNVPVLNLPPFSTLTLSAVIVRFPAFPYCDRGSSGREDVRILAVPNTLRLSVSILISPPLPSSVLLVVNDVTEATRLKSGSISCSKRTTSLALIEILPASASLREAVITWLPFSSVSVSATLRKMLPPAPDCAPGIISESSAENVVEDMPTPPEASIFSALIAITPPPPRSKELETILKEGIPSFDVCLVSSPNREIVFASIVILPPLPSL